MNFLPPWKPRRDGCMQLYICRLSMLKSESTKKGNLVSPGRTMLSLAKSAQYGGKCRLFFRSTYVVVPISTKTAKLKTWKSNNLIYIDVVILPEQTAINIWLVFNVRKFYFVHPKPKGVRQTWKKFQSHVATGSVIDCPSDLAPAFLAVTGLARFIVLLRQWAH